ncbi:MAG: RNA polymerase sigma factor [Thermoanaerobaculia bacterium]|nr:RNA polymerase sigma factor [Thermoanaerobaculia bacterium]
MRQHGTQPSDQEVMNLVVDGDFSQLDCLFDRYHRKLYAYCLRMTSNREVAQDLVQDVFLRVLKYRHTYQPGRAVAPWIFRMARNSSIDHLRRRGREVPHEDLDWEDPAPRLVPVEELQKREELAQLRSALDKLAVDRRDLLVMARFTEMKYDEIAESLGCSVGAVKVRVHRAMKELRELFGQLSREAVS